MITAEHIKPIVAKALQSTENFLVDVKVNPGNRIIVLLDNINGLAIDECVRVSKFIEGTLDREAEDFELQVSSPGLESPFKVIEQYTKSIGKQVEVTTIENQKIIGKLIEADENSIAIEETSKNKKEASQKKIVINRNQIKQTKRIISFKF
jgi:ribosome maturation factor RimP